ncbi:hypothetical protein PAPYR_11954 [Paratrimastix pyriformis]|uniref:Uncharacterized protein n=1 Tax=Paratrimastix pyriformis TaxID=342808 RepID=A0ABQ8U2P8_9EUKA|nr:hypothetical protein PAPYR_11954 [Paratrimastix pyriformis]
MISEPRKIKLLESVVEAGKRWKLVKLLDVCDWGTYASSTPNNQVPMLTTARTRRHQGVWGCSRRSGGSLIAKEMSRLSPGALQTSSDLPRTQMSIFPAARASTQWGRLVRPLHFRAEHVSTTSDPGWGIISDCRGPRSRTDRLHRRTCFGAGRLTALARRPRRSAFTTNHVTDAIDCDAHSHRCERSFAALPVLTAVIHTISPLISSLHP